METQIRLRLETREPFAEGLSFGNVGAYERLIGRVFFEVDPEAPAYRQVVDLDLAPRKASGTVLVPCVDADGKDVPGIRTPHVEVPLATFTGWNPRAEGYGAPALASIVGSYFPFSATAAQRRASGDARPSLAERYRSQADYVQRIAMAAQKLVDARLLLEEDAERYVERAMQENIGYP